MGRTERGKSARPGRGDAEYNRIMEARREYEASLAPPVHSKPPNRTPRVQPVIVTRKGGDEVTYEPQNHADYISSRKWHNRKARYYRDHDKRCNACGTKDKIHLHHKTYVRMGSELDEDLVPLCESCHTKVHKIHRADRTRGLEDVTEQFIKVAQLRRKKAAKKRKRFQ